MYAGRIVEEGPAEDVLRAPSPAPGVFVDSRRESKNRIGTQSARFPSHSLPVVAQVATRVAVMRAGQFVETGPVVQILQRPAHPYTRELPAAVPEVRVR